MTVPLGALISRRPSSRFDAGHIGLGAGDGGLDLGSAFDIPLRVAQFQGRALRRAVVVPLRRSARRLSALRSSSCRMARIGVASALFGRRDAGRILARLRPCWPMMRLHHPRERLRGACLDHRDVAALDQLAAAPGLGGVVGVLVAATVDAILRPGRLQHGGNDGQGEQAVFHREPGHAPSMHDGGEYPAITAWHSIVPPAIKAQRPEMAPNVPAVASHHPETTKAAAAALVPVGASPAATYSE